MNMIWYECEVCCYGTSSSKHADDHEDDTKHTVIDVSDEEEAY